MPKHKELGPVTLAEENPAPVLSISSWKGHIRIDFGSAHDYLAMTPDEAIDFAKALFLRANAEKMIK